MDDLLSIAQQAVDQTLKSGAQQADVVAIRTRRVSAEVERTAIKSCDVVRDHGVGIRAFYEGGMGLSYTTTLDPDDIARCAEAAANLAKAAHPDPDFVTLPSPGPEQEVPELFDPQVDGLDVGEIIEWCSVGIDAARAVTEDVIVAGGAGFASGEKALASSEGVGVTWQATNVGMSLYCIVRRGEDVGAFFEFDSARRLCDFDPAPIGEKATRTALTFLGARSLPTGTLPVVFGPLAANSLIGAVVGAANAESVQRKTSYLVGKKGERIASEHLTVVDAPLHPGGLASSPYDGEGVTRTRMTLIDRGVLKTYLHNSYTANKTGEPNTGHAARPGYTSLVGIAGTNMQISPGIRTEAELIAQIDNGLYVNSAGLTPHGVTGEISGTVDFGFRIHKGMLAEPVRTTMIGANVLELLAKIDAVSSDFREEPGNIMPSIRVDGLQVAGAS